MTLTLSVASICHVSWSQIYSTGSTDIFQWFTKYVSFQTYKKFCGGRGGGRIKSEDKTIQLKEISGAHLMTKKY
jgi:hypothetical protein